MSTWEERMAGRASQRAAAKQAAEKVARLEQYRSGALDFHLPGHEGHHEHVRLLSFECSCGVHHGLFSGVPLPEEETAALSCSVCGKRGLVAARDWSAELADSVFPGIQDG